MNHDEIAAALVDELAEAGYELDLIDIQAIEAYTGQLYRMRAARDIIEEEGLLYEGLRGTGPHPAVEIERLASQEMRQWVTRRPDLFAPPEEVEPYDAGTNPGDAPGNGDVLSGL